MILLKPQYKEITTEEKWQSFTKKFFPGNLVVILDKILERINCEYLD